MITDSIEAFVRAAVAEDVGRGDLFARIDEPKEIRAYMLAKSDGVFGGRLYIDVLAKLYGLQPTWDVRDGEAFKKGKKLVRIVGESTTLLSLERTILDMALHASSIATSTAQYVKALEGTDTILLDTRKTRPLLREFEKYAVRCGGGVNHRMGLDDCLMLKDTHLKTIDDLDAFMRKVRRTIPFTAKVEIECETFETAKKAMAAGADIVMCDNMSIEETARVVDYRNEHYPHVLLEASGNITLETIRTVAQTGVDAISTGATIHQSRWIDLSMKVE
jgi:nicotinate-nucleotide pyrophosphorylase (carboxylating)